MAALVPAPCKKDIPEPPTHAILHLPNLPRCGARSGKMWKLHASWLGFACRSNKETSSANRSSAFATSHHRMPHKTVSA